MKGELLLLVVDNRIERCSEGAGDVITGWMTPGAADIQR
jgi:hypothetical protein